LQMTDARVLGRMVDAAILVTRAKQTTRDALVAATKRFAEDRIRVLGTILNDWNPKRSQNGYYGYYRDVGYYKHNEAAAAGSAGD
jgi:Mrp family chromosome partitioning ATPase